MAALRKAETELSSAGATAAAAGAAEEVGAIATMPVRTAPRSIRRAPAGPPTVARILSGIAPDPWLACKVDRRPLHESVRPHRRRGPPIRPRIAGMYPQGVASVIAQTVNAQGGSRPVDTSRNPLPPKRRGRT